MNCHWWTYKIANQIAGINSQADQPFQNFILFYFFIPSTKMADEDERGAKRRKFVEDLRSRANKNQQNSTIKLWNTRDKILLKPGMYMGSTEAETKDAYVLHVHTPQGEDDDRPRLTLEQKEVLFTPAWLKVAFQEIRDNVRDAYYRGAKQMNRVEFHVDQEQGVIRIRNNGSAIPIRRHEQEPDFYEPEIALARHDAGQSFDAVQGTGDELIGFVIGENGYGAFLTNLTAVWFRINIRWADVDAQEWVTYTQVFRNFLTERDDPVIKRKKFTKKDIFMGPEKVLVGQHFELAYQPNPTFFDLRDTDDNGKPQPLITDDMLGMLRYEAMVGSIGMKGVRYFFNGEDVSMHSFAEYSKLLLASHHNVHTYEFHPADKDGYLAVTLGVPDDPETLPIDSGVINGSACHYGLHINNIRNDVTEPLKAYWERGLSKVSDKDRPLFDPKGRTSRKATDKLSAPTYGGRKVQPDRSLGKARLGFSMVIYMQLRNTDGRSMYASQTKEIFSYLKSKWGFKPVVDYQALDMLLGSEVMTRAENERKQKEKVRQSEGGGAKAAWRLYDIDNFSDAELAGELNNKQFEKLNGRTRRLFLTEGLSALKLPNAAMDREIHGSFPLRGVPANIMPKKRAGKKKLSGAAAAAAAKKKKKNKKRKVGEEGVPKEEEEEDQEMEEGEEEEEEEEEEEAQVLDTKHWRLRGTNNVELRNIARILGLSFGQVIKFKTEIRYDKVVIMADTDDDGLHIQGLLQLFFRCAWPEILELDPEFIEIFVIPLYILEPRELAKKKVGGKKIKFAERMDRSAVLFSDAAFKKVLEDQYDGDEDKAVKALDIQRFKGLGSTTTEHARWFFANIERFIHQLRFIPEETDQSLDIFFNGARVRNRRETLDAWIAEGSKTVDFTQPHFNMPDYIIRTQSQYGTASVERKIPSWTDGFIQSQRLVMWTFFKMMWRHASSDNIKITKLAGEAIEFYKHGDKSLYDVIAKLADMTPVTGRNVNELWPSGMFGNLQDNTRAHARYLYIRHVLFLTQFVFLKNMQRFVKMTHMAHETSGESVPEFIFSIIPWLLVNGASECSIATGTASEMWGCDIRKLIQWTRYKIHSSIKRDYAEAKALCDEKGVEYAQHDISYRYPALPHLSMLPADLTTEDEQRFAKPRSTFAPHFANTIIDIKPMGKIEIPKTTKSVAPEMRKHKYASYLCTGRFRWVLFNGSTLEARDPLVQLMTWDDVKGICVVELPPDMFADGGVYKNKMRDHCWDQPKIIAARQREQKAAADKDNKKPKGKGKGKGKDASKKKAAGGTLPDEKRFIDGDIVDRSDAFRVRYYMNVHSRARKRWSEEWPEGPGQGEVYGKMLELLKLKKTLTSHLLVTINEKGLVHHDLTHQHVYNRWFERVEPMFWKFREFTMDDLGKKLTRLENEIRFIEAVREEKIDVREFKSKAEFNAVLEEMKFDRDDKGSYEYLTSKHLYAISQEMIDKLNGRSSDLAEEWNRVRTEHYLVPWLRYLDSAEQGYNDFERDRREKLFDDPDYNFVDPDDAPASYKKTDAFLKAAVKRRAKKVAKAAKAAKVGEKRARDDDEPDDAPPAASKTTRVFTKPDVKRRTKAAAKGPRVGEKRARDDNDVDDE